MNRYLLRFNKTGYMRFISHLDLAKLFKRCIKKAEIPIAWSQGFNPHELASIVQPLSLGYESESEYYEMDTQMPIDMLKALKDMNKTTPDGVKFTAIREIPVRHLSLSAATETAVYEAKVFADFKDFRMEEYLNRPEIEIYKRDKKTKEMVPKDAKDQIKRLVFEDFIDEKENGSKKTIEQNDNGFGSEILIEQSDNGFESETLIEQSDNGFESETLIEQNDNGFGSEKPSEQNNGIEKISQSRAHAVFTMEVACGSNNTLNPMNLLVSLYKFHGIKISSEDVRIKRIDMLIGGKSAFDSFK